jgi:hypothetical protein
MNGVKKFFLFLQIGILLFLPSVATAQSADELKKIFAQAESYFLYEEYELANQLYLLLDSPDNLNIKYKIGTCYLNIPGEKEKAIPFLEEAVKNASYDAREELFKEKRAPLDSYFSLAKAYMINNQLEKSMATYETFRKLAGETQSKGGMQNFDYVDQQIKACQNALILKDNPLVFSKKSLGPDFSLGSINENPAVSFDGNTLVYTEKRGLINVILFSKKVNGVWESPVEITSELNAGEDCTSCSLNSNGTILYLYKTDNYDGAIYSSDYINGKWTPIKKLNKNINTKFYESHASVSADGQKLYFASNRDGGLGNLDLYVSEKDQTGDWGPAKNLGSVINTPYNEDTPFIIANDSILYFSSEGHSSMGGFDNYKSVRSGSNWNIPENIGYPVNTPDDDKFFDPANNGSNAFYSITTDYKKKEIFYLDFGSAGMEFSIKGKVNLSDTTLAFDSGFPFYLVNRENGDTIDKAYPNAYTGSYHFNVKTGSYRIIYTGFGYFSKTIDTTLLADRLTDVNLNVTLERDPSVRRHVSGMVYDRIDLGEIPTITEVDTSILIKNLNVNDIADELSEEPDVLYYTVQVIALHKPVDVSYFRHIGDLKVLYNEQDKFYRYTTGVFSIKEDAYKHRLELISKGYPDDIFVKKVTRQLIATDNNK